MKRSFKIYKITCKINNKVYIGQTIETLTQRFNRHMGYQKDEHDTKFIGLLESMEGIISI